MRIHYPAKFGDAVIKEEGHAYNELPREDGMTIVEKKVIFEKGAKNGECNRTACENVPADWYNQYTQRWYCKSCADRINAIATHKICDRR